MANKIYIGNLPYNTSEQEVEEVFSQFGSIEDVALIKDRHTGLKKGFGFITFQDADAVKKAVEEMNGQSFKGRTIKVNEAEEKSGGSGGRDRDRGGQGGGGGKRW